jgi:hypothetical protein
MRLRGKDMKTMLEDIIQALMNLGGQGTLEQIYKEVERIRTSPLPKTWQASIRGRIEQNSSDSGSFNGKDYFRKVAKGTWALRDRDDVKAPVPLRQIGETKKQEVFLQPDEFEIVSNYLRTIKEFRDYSDPASLNWIDYIQEFFHVIGFNTDKKDSRLILLRHMDGDNAPRVIVAYMLPGENCDEILPGLSWDAYLVFAANYYQIQWGVLTNGLQLKIFNCGNRDHSSTHFWPDLDGIIRDQKLDSFFTVYKIFSSLQSHKEEHEQIITSLQDLQFQFWKG